MKLITGVFFLSCVMLEQGADNKMALKHWNVTIPQWNQSSNQQLHRVEIP